jgi:hypothetical protein
MRGGEGRGGYVDDKCATLYTARGIHNTHATYILASEIDSLARFKVVECAHAFKSDSLVHPVAHHQTLRDLPLHSVAKAAAPLLRARQYKQPQQQPSSTHQTIHDNLRHAAVALQPLSNRTTPNIRQTFAVPLHYKPSNAPPAPDTLPHSHAHFTHVRAKRQAPPTPITYPCLPSQSSSGA